MGYSDTDPQNNKMRIIQEIVPGRQITLAHVIANPEPILCRKLNFNGDCDIVKGAIGILTMSPNETAIIAADIAAKSSGTEIGFIDYQNGTLIVTGAVSEVEEGVRAVLDYVREVLGFTVCEITRT